MEYKQSILLLKDLCIEQFVERSGLTQALGSRSFGPDSAQTQRIPEGQDRSVQPGCAREERYAGGIACGTPCDSGEARRRRSRSNGKVQSGPTQELSD
jgi:hypothetical protein